MKQVYRLQGQCALWRKGSAGRVCTARASVNYVHDIVRHKEADAAITAAEGIAA